MEYKFLAEYENVITCQLRYFDIIVNQPEFTEKECYIEAMEIAYDNLGENELLALLEFITF